MSANYLADNLKVADLVALKAIAAGDRRDGMIKIVDAITSPTPNYNLKDISYRYDASSSLDAAEPAIVEPDDSAGRYIMDSPRIHFATTAPTNPPVLGGLIWIALLDTPTRKVIWRSRFDLPDTPTVDDWIPDYTTTIDGVPTFNADYVGQIVEDSNTNYKYRAINITGDWILSYRDNELVVGADITGDETVGLSYHGTRKKLTSSAIITVPSGLININFQLISYGVTLTVRAGASTTLNNATADIVLTDAIANVFNIGDDWYVS